MRRPLAAGASMAALAFVAGLGLAGCQQQSSEGKKAGEAAKTGEAPAAVSAAPATPGGPPRRRPGLWSQTVSTAGMSQTSKICLDADTDAKMTAWGQRAGSSLCAKNSFAPAAGGGWAVESECDMGEGGKIATKGLITGDFNSGYTAKMTSVTTGAAMAQANGAHEITVTAKWEGACPADMTPGDMRLANGMTVNMEAMAGP